ncbi:MAG: transcriptional regulator [Gammaproteobacteria bacterium]|nr:transcriptional regulator [Gammaproteobacteria bacterium]
MSDFDYKQLDDIIHSRIRLAVMAVLASLKHADFSFLKAKVNATDGNLSVHLRKLEEAEYIKVDKRFIERKPVSQYQLTKKGREAFKVYIDRLESLISPTSGDKS